MKDGDQPAPLTDGEARLLACLENTPHVAIQWFDREGRVIFWNTASELMFGFTSEEAMGRTLDQLIHTPEETHAFIEALRMVESTGQPVGPVEYSFRNRASESRVCLSTIFSIPAPDQQQWFVCMDVDVTERRKIETALRESEERLRLALAAVQMGIWEWRIDANEVRWSEMVEPIFGLPKDSFAGTYEAYLALVHPNDLERVDGTIRETVLRGSSDYLVRHRVIGEGGRIEWIEARGQVVKDANGKPARMIGIVRNVTKEHQHAVEREETIEALRLSEERFRSMMHDSPIGTAIVAPDGRWLDVNQTLCDIAGYTREELLSTNVSVITHPDDMPKDWELAHKLMAREISKYQMEKRYIHKSGHSIWVQLNTSMVRNPDGTPRHFISHIQDITERRALEDRQRQAQKMESVGQLAGGIAHDFNNILATVMMQADMALSTDGTINDDTRQLLNDIKTSAETASNLTQQLLLFSRKQLLQPRVLDCNDIVSKMTRIMKRVLRDNIHIQIDLHPEPLMIFADPGMMDQILLNLSVNARDAMPKGGTLTIATAFEDVQDDNSEALPSGRFARITVSDTGTGIAQEHLSRIYEPFFTTKEPGQGTGLGLATVFSIVKQHEGDISVRSDVGDGTTFNVRLPLSNKPRSANGEASPPPLRAGGEVLLLVEDNDAVRGISRVILTRNGYTVHEAPDAHAALAMWESLQGRIDLLLTDLIMPGGINGFELATTLLKIKPDLCVVYASGYHPDIVAGDVEIIEGLNYLPKPYTSAQLLNVVCKRLQSPK